MKIRNRVVLNAVCLCDGVDRLPNHPRCGHGVHRHSEHTVHKVRYSPTHWSQADLDLGIEPQDIGVQEFPTVVVALSKS